jgi:Domain of unknown function (DUF3786)
MRRKTMSLANPVFEKNYSYYLDEIAKVDLGAVKDTLGCRVENDQVVVPFFGQEYSVSRYGITDEAGQRPGYVACVVLAKYILLCPAIAAADDGWVSFKDFKTTSHFTNINYFASDTEQAIVKGFSGRLPELIEACRRTGGVPHEADMPYELSVRFEALPRVSLLLLFNDRDDEFPAGCTMLFNRHAESYLDPESLAMTGSFLARSLNHACEKF